MRNVLFLDIDGVLNSGEWNDAHSSDVANGILIDSEKVKLLSSLVQKTDAKIILHSGWRFWFDENLKSRRQEAEYFVNLLEKEGLHIADVTPDLTTEEIRRTKKFSLVKADELCREIYVFAKKTMNALKKVYGAESFYLCTMCDGPMNHFHIQLIPRYSFEKRGSGIFVKERKTYNEDKEKIIALRNLLN